MKVRVLNSIFVATKVLITYFSLRIESESMELGSQRTVLNPCDGFDLNDLLEVEAFEAESTTETDLAVK